MTPIELFLSAAVVIQTFAIVYLWNLAGSMLKMFESGNKWMEAQEKINTSFDKDIRRLTKL